MKKILAILLVLTAILSLASCKKNYPAVDSTEEEARTVMTLTVGNNTYSVKYELYRALFLTYKSQVDGGNPDVWQSENKAEYTELIDKLIIDRIVEIYAAFELCDQIGFDIYSNEVEEKIKENIRISVEGGTYGSAKIEGFDNYEDYLAWLKSMNLNYSVQTLLFRYAIAVDAIDTYYIGTVSSDDVDIELSQGALEYTRDDVKSFYDSDDCVRVLRANFQKAISYTPLDKAEKLASDLKAAADSKDTLNEKEKAVFNAIMGKNSYTNSEELKTGYVIGRYNLERSYYGDMTDAAFSISVGEVSAPIDIVTDVENAYYVLYKTYKSDEHFTANYDDIKYIYLMNCVGKISYDVAEELRSSITYSDFLKSIDHSQIKM